MKKTQEMMLNDLKRRKIDDIKRRKTMQERRHKTSKNTVKRIKTRRLNKC
jgi:hypothetical protein